MSYLFSNISKILRIAVFVLALPQFVIAASLEEVKEECRSVVSAFISSQEDAQAWHHTQISYFQTLADEQDVREFIKGYTCEEDTLSAPLELIRNKAEHLFKEKNEQSSALLKRYTDLESSISDWTLETDVLSKKLKTLLLQCLVDLTHRSDQGSLLYITLPSDMESYTDLQRKLAEEDINRYKDVAFLMQLMAKPLQKEKIDSIFGSFKQHAFLGGHFSVLQAYVQDLIFNAPLPDHYLYRFKKMEISKRHDEEVERVQGKKDLAAQSFQTEPDEQTRTLLATTSRSKKEALGTSVERLRLKLIEKNKELLTTTLPAKAQKLRQELLQGFEKEKEIWHDWLTRMSEFTGEPDMVHIKELEERAVALLDNYNKGFITAGQWRLEQAEREAQEKSKHHKADEELFAGVSVGAPLVAENEDSASAAYDVSTGSLAAEDGVIGADTALEEQRLLLLEGGDDYDPVRDDPRAAHVWHQNTKRTRTAERQPRAEEDIFEAVRLLPQDQYVLWEHFWGMSQHQHQDMQWGSFTRLFEGLGFKVTTQSGGAMRKVSNGERSFHIHEPHGRRGDMLGVFDIKRIRRNLNDKFGWSFESYQEKKY